MENLATYSEARSEYTKQLATFIVPSLVGWFQQLWGRNATDRNRCMALFQGECEEIPRWNSDRIHDEVRVLIERTGCDYMEELMTAVFIAHTKVLGPGEKEELVFKAPAEPGDYDYICSFPGHYLTGMKGLLTVKAK